MAAAALLRAEEGRLLSSPLGVVVVLGWRTANSNGGRR